VHRGNSVIRRETRFHISVRNPDKMHVRGAITPAVRGELARHIEKSRRGPKAKRTLLPEHGDLCVAVSMVPGEGIGPNVCPLGLNGWPL
jgi:hypothetical protein